MTQTLRFNVFLDPKSTENYEISWIDLIKQNKPAENETNKDELANLEILVKKLEANYGPVAYAKGKKIRVNDYVDQGNGYDIDDGFIDDTMKDEAIIISTDLMTEYGGFFINSNTLKINEDALVIDKVDNDIAKLKSSKKKLSHNAIGLKSKSHLLLMQARKRCTVTTNNNSKKRLSKLSDKKLEQIFDEIISVNEKTSPMQLNVDINSNGTLKPILNLSPMKEDDVVKVNNSTLVTQVKLFELPLGLSEAVMEKIRLLMEICDKSKQEGSKVPQQFNIILFELDTILLSSNQKGVKATRTNVMRYISQYADMKYDTMLRRICKIKETKKKVDSKSLFVAMEDAINEAMVESMLAYEKATKQYAAQVDEQRLIIAQSQNPSEEGDIEAKLKANKIRLPKREFTWSLDCKTLLFQLSRNEFDAYQASSNKVTPEEHLMKFYQTNVMNLFPPKWMTISKLMKVSQPLLTEFKKSISNGKDSNPVSPTVKPKLEAKISVAVKENPAPVILFAKNNDKPSFPEMNFIRESPDVGKPMKPKSLSLTSSAKKTPRISALMASSGLVNISPMLTPQLINSRKRPSTGLLLQADTFNGNFIDLSMPSSYVHSSPKQICRTPVTNDAVLQLNQYLTPQEIFKTNYSQPMQYDITEENTMQAIPDISTLLSSNYVERQRKPKCSFFPFYCNSPSHNIGSICYQTMEQYYHRKVFGRKGYICPGCNGVAIGSFDEFIHFHGHHLCQFTTISKGKIVQLGNISMLPSSELTLPMPDYQTQQQYSSSTTYNY